MRKDLLFSGTETGLYWSLDAGTHWRPLRLNRPGLIADLDQPDGEVKGALPLVPITDLVIGTSGSAPFTSPSGWSRSAIRPGRLSRSGRQWVPASSDSVEARLGGAEERSLRVGRSAGRLRDDVGGAHGPLLPWAPAHGRGPGRRPAGSKRRARDGQTPEHELMVGELVRELLRDEADLRHDVMFGARAALAVERIFADGLLRCWSQRLPPRAA